MSTVSEWALKLHLRGADFPLRYMLNALGRIEVSVQVNEMQYLGDLLTLEEDTNPERALGRRFQSSEVAIIVAQCLSGIYERSRAVDLENNPLHVSASRLVGRAHRGGAFGCRIFGSNAVPHAGAANQQGAEQDQ
jgi:hypothetical protein